MQYIARHLAASVLVLSAAAAGFGDAAQAQGKKCPYWGGMGAFLGFSIGCRFATFTMDDVEKHWPEFVRKAGWACSAAEVDKMIAEARLSDPDNWDNTHDICDSVRHYEKQVQVLNQYFATIKR